MVDQSIRRKEGDGRYRHKKPPRRAGRDRKAIGRDPTMHADMFRRKGRARSVLVFRPRGRLLGQATTHQALPLVSTEGRRYMTGGRSFLAVETVAEVTAALNRR